MNLDESVVFLRDEVPAGTAEFRQKIIKTKQELKRRIGKKITLDCRDYMAFSILDTRIRIRGVLESVFDWHFVITRKFGNTTVRDSFTLIDLCTGEVRLLK